MTPERQRIAIAEACGPKLFVLHKPLHDPFGYYRENANGYTNDINKAWWVPEDVARRYTNGGPDQPDRVVAEPAPTHDYLNDLNAMREAECSPILRAHGLLVYVGILAEVVWKANGRPHGISIADKVAACVFATAAQRAEAFLKTIGKWEDS